MGVITTLWPALQNLCDLAQLRRDSECAFHRGELAEATAMHQHLEAASLVLMAELREWKPPLNLGDERLDGTESKSSVEQGILHNALGYRDSACVYLQRVVLRCPSEDTLVQRHAHDSLVHCYETACNSGVSLSALLWPLFMAACEARYPGDRKLAEQAFGALCQRQRMLNIERAWRVVCEVWRRADLAAGQDPQSTSRQSCCRWYYFQGSTFGDPWWVVCESLELNLVLG